MGRSTGIAALLATALAAGGCSLYARTNRRLAEPPDTPLRVTFDVAEPRGRKDVLVLLALSGGGSRAAYFATCIMFRLEEVLDEIDVLGEVDVISAVSGGCLPAAYYCISKDAPERAAPDDPKPDDAPERQTFVGRIARRSVDTLFGRRYWKEEDVKDLIARNYLWRWIGNWFWPHNIIRYWFTAFDRSDIMAATLANSLFDHGVLARDYRLSELNPERPYLILNATDGTESVEGEEHFGTVFTFTAEDFEEKLDSDISRYSLARAVMASASFPAVFNYMTLEDYRDLPGSPKRRFLHVFDGGNSDNLGLTSVKRVIVGENQRRAYSHYVVVSVDAHIRAKGVDRNAYDARSFFSYFLDLNLIDTMDSLLDSARSNTLDEFAERRLVPPDGAEPIENLTFWHIQFDDVPRDIEDPYGDGTLLEKLHDIPTSFQISRKNRERIEKAVDLILRPEHPRLAEIRKVLLAPMIEPGR